MLAFEECALADLALTIGLSIECEQEERGEGELVARFEVVCWGCALLSLNNRSLLVVGHLVERHLLEVVAAHHNHLANRIGARYVFVANVLMQQLHVLAVFVRLASDLYMYVLQCVHNHFASNIHLHILCYRRSVRITFRYICC